MGLGTTVIQNGGQSAMIFEWPPYVMLFEKDGLIRYRDGSNWSHGCPLPACYSSERAETPEAISTRCRKKLALSRSHSHAKTRFTSSTRGFKDGYRSGFLCRPLCKVQYNASHGSDKRS